MLYIQVQDKRVLLNRQRNHAPRLPSNSQLATIRQQQSSIPS